MKISTPFPKQLKSIEIIIKKKKEREKMTGLWVFVYAIASVFKSSPRKHIFSKIKM